MEKLEKLAWNIFTRTGKVTDYIYYKRIEQLAKAVKDENYLKDVVINEENQDDELELVA